MREGSPAALPERSSGGGRPRGRHDRSALDSIPWRDRLSTQVLMVGGALMLAAIATFAGVEMALARQRLSGVTASTALLSETIAASVRQAMLRDERAEA
ncbi:MAG: hypothetical protein NTY18_01800, partial [Deltaproteobacteria bacterium]|nr:hypothetical protein [Deltaproteobacteria bacterium]